MLEAFRDQKHCSSYTKIKTLELWKLALADLCKHLKLYFDLG